MRVAKVKPERVSVGEGRWVGYLPWAKGLWHALVELCYAIGLGSGLDRADVPPVLLLPHLNLTRINNAVRIHVASAGSHRLVVSSTYVRACVRVCVGCACVPENRDGSPRGGETALTCV